MRRSSLLLVAVLAAACAGPGPASQAPAASASVTPSAAALGPGGLTLDEEVGAVIMVGFRGPLTEAVVSDWKQRQFGGLLVVNLNQNAATAPALTALIGQLRAANRHRLLAATDQEGGQICLAVSTVPCLPMPVDAAGTTRMAAALGSLGFDLDLGPVSDVCSGPESVMWGRCYGTEPAAVAAAVGPVVRGIHAAHLLSAAKHFPGHGDTTVSSETDLPRIDASLATLQSREWPPFQAAIAAGTDFVLVGHLFYPALDPQRAASLSPAALGALRNQLGFRGAIVSDDLQMGAITKTTPAPEAAVEFLLAGGDLAMIAHSLDVADATYDAIRQAVVSGRLPRKRLDQAVATLQALPAK
ncbi:MAG TPA: glycoside hydrolase family 3 N-terminal domain-containing protein [Candidatus Dormibacteraeota bacterium]